MPRTKRATDAAQASLSEKAELPTVSGISNLSNLVSSLPLPRPRRRCAASSLLHPEHVASAAEKLLSADDDGLARQLSDALSKTQVPKDIEPVVQHRGLNGVKPALLKSILDKNPNVFSPASSGAPRADHCPATGLACDVSPQPACPAPTPPERQTSIQCSDTDVDQTSVSADVLCRELRVVLERPVASADGSFSVSDNDATPTKRSQTNSPRKQGTKRRRLSDDIASATVDTSSASSSSSLTTVATNSMKPTSLHTITTATMVICSSLLEDSGPVVLDSNSVHPIEVVVDTSSSIEHVTRRNRRSKQQSVAGVCLSNSRRASTAKVTPTTTQPAPSSRCPTQRMEETVVVPPVVPCHGSPPVTCDPAVVKRKDRRKKHSLAEDDWSSDPTLARFSSVVEEIFHAAEGLDLASETRDTDDEGASDAIQSPVSKLQLSALLSEAAKLKLTGLIGQVPSVKLVRLMRILCLSVRSGCCLISQIDCDYDEGDEDQEESLTKIDEHVAPALDAAAAALYLMTSADVPKEVFLEDLIEWMVKLVKMQLFSVIYPMYGSVKSDRSRGRTSDVRDKIVQLYFRVAEIMSLLAELVNSQELTDTILLQISTAAVSPFFVEDVSELQLNALHLVTGVFSRYEAHQQSILEDILSSLASLPSNKKNLRMFRLSAGENVQMVTALVLQLIQSVVRLPDVDTSGLLDTSDKKELEEVMLSSYKAAMRTAYRFLSVFLSKCTSPKGKGEDDYRPLFDNFVNDLLTMTNKPEWPAAELVLSILGGLLVKRASTKSVEMPARVAALDYLGTVASRLRKDAALSKLDSGAIEYTVSEIIGQDDEANCRDQTTGHTQQSNCKVLQSALLDYLADSSKDSPTVLFARRFYLAQWYQDCAAEVEKLAASTPTEATPSAPVAPPPKNMNRRKTKKKKVPTATLR